MNFDPTTGNEIVNIGSGAITAPGTLVLQGTVTNSALVPATAVADKSGTIAATGTFQAIVNTNTLRAGGLVQNLSSNTMSVFPGAPGSATLNTSALLNAGKALDFTFGTPGRVYQGTISIAGTATDKFWAVENT